MKTIALLLATAGAAVMTTPALAEVYDVDISGNGLSAIGTITTDGTLGVLSAANVTAFGITIDDGDSSFFLDGYGNAQLDVTGSGFTATATGLFFDFSGTGYALFQNPFIGSGINFLCFAGSLCGGDSNRISITVDEFGGGIAQTGIQQVATRAGGVVPEPATWAMMIGGLGLAGGALRTRRRTVAYA